eukprot:880950-Pyramimonas_sp.AAC.1
MGQKSHVGLTSGQCRWHMQSYANSIKRTRHGTVDWDVNGKELQFATDGAWPHSPGLQEEADSREWLSQRGAWWKNVRFVPCADLYGAWFRCLGRVRHFPEPAAQELLQ